MLARTQINRKSVGMQSGPATLKTFGSPYRVKHRPTALLSNHTPRNLGIEMTPNGLTMYVQTKDAVFMFPAASFLIAKNRKQPRCPLIGD